MESHHQSMSRLIAEWHYQQEKGLMWKEWAEGVLDGQPIRRSPTGRDRLKQMRVETPRTDRTGLASPNAGGCADSPCSFSII